MTDPRTLVASASAVFGDPRASTAGLLCDRHPAESIAFTVVEPDLASVELTFGELRERSSRVATALAELGVGRGDRVATLMGKSVELVVAVVAIWRLGAVHVPLFTAFAPPAIRTRITGNGTKVVITDADQRPKLDSPEDFGSEPAWRIVTTGAPGRDDVAFDDLLTASPQPAPVAVGGDATIIELFTSGTTGRPKGVPVPLRAGAALWIYQQYGLDHQPFDVFWNAADPGWAYGLYHAVTGPLILGRTSLLLRGGFSPAVMWSVLSKFGVTNLAAGPTVYRALRASGLPAPADLRLRHCSSAGEPLGADVVTWAEKNLGPPIRDHYGQTELGMAAANAWHPDVAAPPRPGSMGRALPGWTVDVLRPDADEPAAAGEPGRIAVDVPASPLMWFDRYRNAPEATAERFTADRRWYLTGDTATKDADGYLSFAARDDDVILMAGYRIDPYEVESVLQLHDDVVEAAVVATPDEVRGEVLVAYVVSSDGVAGTAEFATELQQLVKTRLAAHAYPRQIHFVPSLPRTPSGKLQRFLLRER